MFALYFNIIDKLVIIGRTIVVKKKKNFRCGVRKPTFPEGTTA